MWKEKDTHTNYLKKLKRQINHPRLTKKNEAPSGFLFFKSLMIKSGLRLQARTPRDRHELLRFPDGTEWKAHLLFLAHLFGNSFCIVQSLFQMLACTFKRGYS